MRIQAESRQRNSFLLFRYYVFLLIQHYKLFNSSFKKKKHQLELINLIRKL